MPNVMPSPLIFIGGGARSGKSRAAIAYAKAVDTPRVFIATAEARDSEMRARIAHHKAERRADFETIEAPRALCAAIVNAIEAKVIVIDCLTLWLSNLVLDGLADDEIETAANVWLDAAQAHPGTVIVVANEVGQGIVPDNALSRRFRDLAGKLNQRVAARADHVEVSFFGLSVVLKSPTHEPPHGAKRGILS